MSLSASFRFVLRYAVGSPHTLPSTVDTPQILPRSARAAACGGIGGQSIGGTASGTLRNFLRGRVRPGVERMNIDAASWFALKPALLGAHLYPVTDPVKCVAIPEPGLPHHGASAVDITADASPPLARGHPPPEPGRGLWRQVTERGAVSSGRWITPHAACGTRSARAALRVLEGLRADRSRSGRAGSLDPTRRPEPWRPRFPGGGTQGRSRGFHVSASIQPAPPKPDGPRCTCRAGPPVVRMAGAPCRPGQARSPRGTAATAVRGANRGGRPAGMGSAHRPQLPR